MSNKHGDFVWYELMTSDPEAAKAFYHDVIGWTVGDRIAGDIDYRMISAGENHVGGMLRLTHDMCEQGARPIWLGYIGVDDVDITLAKLRELGGNVLMPPKDIPEAGRIAMVADPQHAPFYIIRGAVEDGTSTAFKPTADGHCSWNELATSDQSGALSFYGQLFGWESNEAMPMGDMGEYHFLDHHDTRIGAVSPLVQESTPIWRHYFHVRDIDVAMTTARARGGKILGGPHEVPGGDHIIIGSDPGGATFALVGPKT